MQRPLRSAVIFFGASAVLFAAGRASAQRPASAPGGVAPTHGNVAYGPHERNVLDLFAPSNIEPTPLVLYIHGGGFRGGDKSRLRQSDLKAFLAAGYAVASINYRLTDAAPAPAAYLDCGRALQFLRHNAEKWRLDPNLVASTGGSAGAGASLWLAFHEDLAEPDSNDPIARESTRLTCVAVTNGQSSYDPRFAEAIGLPRPNFEDHSFFLPFYGIEPDEIDSPQAIKKYEEMAPITHLTKDDPPVLMDYSRPNAAVDKNSDKSLVVHHPLFGIALQDQMNELGLECVVQFMDATGERKIRRRNGEPVMSRLEFIQRQFARARQANHAD